jgi:hypothetical protein
MWQLQTSDDALKQFFFICKRVSCFWFYEHFVLLGILWHQAPGDVVLDLTKASNVLRLGSGLRQVYASLSFTPEMLLPLRITPQGAWLVYCRRRESIKVLLKSNLFEIPCLIHVVDSDLVGGVDSCLQDGDNITMTKVGRLQFKKPNKYWVEGSQKRVSCLLSILWHGRFELVSTNRFVWVVFKQ